MDQPVKCSVAAVIRRPGDPSFLSVRRPLDDEHLPGLWGLPAITLAPGELPESGLRRVGREKLAIDIAPVAFVGIDTVERSDHRLILMDLEAELLEGQPDVEAATGSGTRYIEQRWTDDVETLREAAERGSLCCRILLARTDQARSTGP